MSLRSPAGDRHCNCRLPAAWGFVVAMIMAMTLAMASSCSNTPGPFTSDDRLPELNTVAVQYLPDADIFPNPERGLYTHREWNNAAGSPLSASELTRLRKNMGISLALTIYYMEGYVGKPMDNALLTLISKNFAALRSAGMKSVLRFAYSKSENAKERDAAIEIVLEHIAQLKPLLEQNSDVIAVMEAGFVGVWGEWYYSTHYGSGANPDYALRSSVIDALLQALPPERMIALRTPAFKTRLLQIAYTDTLTAAQAYNRSPKARLAFHNDCFLANATDMGTYTGNADRLYLASDTKYACMGGETCLLATDYAECRKAIAAMEDAHWSYLNRDYHPDVFSFWQQSGCYDEIQRRLGYRFRLIDASHPATITPGSRMELRFRIHNDGFAAPYNPRPLEIVFCDKDRTVVHRAPLAADPRFWFGGQTVEVAESIAIPKSLQPGQYHVFLAMPAPEVSLAARPEYAIRLANKNVWDESSGMNEMFAVEI